jgi:hypothetical protein
MVYLRLGETPVVYSKATEVLRTQQLGARWDPGHRSHDVPCAGGVVEAASEKRDWYITNTYRFASLARTPVHDRTNTDTAP